MDKEYEKIKKTLNEKCIDSSFFSSVVGSDLIPMESLGFFGANTTLSEFLEELKRHGLTVSISASDNRRTDYTPTQKEIENVSLTPAIEDTSKNREQYLKMRNIAQEKLRDTGYMQALMEQEEHTSNLPVDESALEILNAASYQGEFGQLSELSKDLKKQDNKEKGEVK